MNRAPFIFAGFSALTSLVGLGCSAGSSSGGSGQGAGPSYSAGTSSHGGDAGVAASGAGGIAGSGNVIPEGGSAGVSTPTGGRGL